MSGKSLGGANQPVAEYAGLTPWAEVMVTSAKSGDLYLRRMEALTWVDIIAGQCKRKQELDVVLVMEEQAADIYV